jgi:TolB-like protein
MLWFTLAAVLSAGAQTGNRPRLAVLPFTGGNEQEGEAIAGLLSNEADLRGAFTVVDRTVIDAIMEEHDFQSTGLTDSDTIKTLGTQLNAEYVIAGHIQRLSNRNLIHITIVHVEQLQQIAGVYKEYQAIEEVAAFLAPMTRNLVKAAQLDTARLPKLAVLPFDIPGGTDAEATETLAQILASEIANSGKYAVLPRTQAAIDRVMAEQDIQQGSGLTDETTISRLGGGFNAEFVLSGRVITLGRDHYFDVKIVKIDGTVISGDSRRYQSISDGLELMPLLAEYLTGIQDERKQAEARERQQAMEQRKREALEEEKQRQDAEARRAQADEEQRQADQAKQARRRAEAEEKIAWKNKWLYFGLRGGVSLRGYTLNEDIPGDIPDMGVAFEGAVQFSFQFSRFLALQVEGIFTQDTVQYEGMFSGWDGYGDGGSFTSLSMMLPLALKLTFRPGLFLIAPLGGVYFNLPLGDMTFESNDGKESYRFSQPLGFMGGLDLGFKLGPGALFLDSRLGMNMGYTSVNDSGGTLQIYNRDLMLSFSIGYEIGIFTKR